MVSAFAFSFALWLANPSEQPAPIQQEVSEVETLRVQVAELRAQRERDKRRIAELEAEVKSLREQSAASKPKPEPKKSAAKTVSIDDLRFDTKKWEGSMVTIEGLHFIDYSENGLRDMEELWLTNPGYDPRRRTVDRPSEYFDTEGAQEWIVIHAGQRFTGGEAREAFMLTNRLFVRKDLLGPETRALTKNVPIRVTGRVVRLRDRDGYGMIVGSVETIEPNR